MLAGFLSFYKDFWSEEVLTRYPHCFEVFPEDWLHELLEFPLEKLYALDRGRACELIQSPSLKDYFRQSIELVSTPSYRRTASTSIPPRAFTMVKEKKRCEIETLAEFVVNLSQKEKIAQVLDLCGGIGFLAQVLAHHFSIATLCIDSDQKLQNTGSARHQRTHLNNSAALSYICKDLREADRGLAEFLNPKHLSLGLHTCGSLANHHLRLSLELDSPFVLNFGCCYYKAKINEFNISKLGQSTGITLTQPGLTLASRSHRDGEKAFYFSKRVRRFRYMMHLYLYHELGMRSFVSLGRSHKGLYEGEFAEYGMEQLRRLELPTPSRTLQRLSNFYRCEKQQKVVQKMICANIIRAATGRVIELYAICDRGALLEEQGYEVGLANYFDEKLSPRNVGIFARKA